MVVYRMVKYLHISHRGLISNIYIYKKLDTNKPNNPIKKWGTELNRINTGISNAREHLKKCSTSLVIMEMQIKMTLRFHLIPVRMGKLNNTNINSCW